MGTDGSSPSRTLIFGRPLPAAFPNFPSKPLTKMMKMSTSSVSSKASYSQHQNSHPHQHHQQPYLPQEYQLLQDHQQQSLSSAFLPTSTSSMLMEEPGSTFSYYMLHKDALASNLQQPEFQPSILPEGDKKVTQQSLGMLYIFLSKLSWNEVLCVGLRHIEIL